MTIIILDRIIWQLSVNKKDNKCRTKKGDKKQMIK